MSESRRSLIWITPPLASGGMGDIWRVITVGAEGVRNISIVKRIHGNLGNTEEYRKMFIDEARITSQLHRPIPHHNIIQIQEFQEFDDEYLLFMEYVNGRDVSKILNRCYRRKVHFPIPHSLYIIGEVLNGLHHAHNSVDMDGNRLKVIHRDISPPNILVSFSGDVKIIDWGIADAKMKTSKTVIGVIKGKYGYMSPEQARGEKLDHRTDIYSAGIVLWEMLTGRPLFEHKNDIQVLTNIQKGKIKDPRKFNKKVNDRLAALVLKALSLKKEDRFKNCHEFGKYITRERVRIAPEHDKNAVGKKIFNEDIKKDEEIISKAEKEAPKKYPPEAYGRQVVYDKKPEKKSKEDDEKNKKAKLQKMSEAPTILDIQESTENFESLELERNVKEDGPVKIEDSLKSIKAREFSDRHITVSKKIRELKTKSHRLLNEVPDKVSSVKVNFLLLSIAITFAFLLYFGGDIAKYVLKEAGMTKAAKNVTRSGVLEIQSPFKGLTVKVAGSTYRKATILPLTIKNMVPNATYIIEISKPGYQTIFKKIVIEKNTKYVLKVPGLIPGSFGENRSKISKTDLEKREHIIQEVFQKKSAIKIKRRKMKRKRLIKIIQRN